MERHLILADNMERFEKKMTAIQNKCKKYNFEFAYNNLGPKFVTFDNCLTGEKETRKYFEVECSGQVKHNGWEFIATIDPHTEGNIIRAYNTEVEIPQMYQTSDCTCDHCHTKRSRKNTYIIHNADTNEWKQVGGSCLAEFTLGLDAEAVAHYIAMYDEVIKGEAPYGGSSYTRYYDRNAMLEIATECVNKFGYFNSECQRPTRLRATEYYNLHLAPSRLFEKERANLKQEVEDANFIFESEENKHFVEDALKWIASTTDTSSYFNNLRIICSEEFVEPKNTGFLVSLIPTYKRYLGDVARKEKIETAHQKEAAESSHFASVGDRVSIKPDEIKLMSSWENQYGYTHLYKIVAEGNVFVWYASSCIDEDKEILSITGTVKEHSEFNGVKQTVLTRCKVAYAPVAKKEPEVTPNNAMEEIFAAIDMITCGA